MKRTIEFDLLSWKTQRAHKPIILRGARQVGKSFIVRQFGKQHFQSMIEINLDQEPSLASLFVSQKPIEIIKYIETRFGMAVIPGQTLLFIDEIQAAPEVIGTLRYFKEQMPDLHVLAAGSLLDFALADFEHSMPVGRIEFLFMGPLGFEEFLSAMSLDYLVQFLKNYQLGDLIPQAIHDQLYQHFREYSIIGGMPEAVLSYSVSRQIKDSQRVHRSILNTYRDDFAKYKKRINVLGVRTVFENIPTQVGKTTKYLRLNPNSNSRDISEVLKLLQKARVAHLVRHTPCLGIPIGAEASQKIFKTLFLDVGLMQTLLGYPPLEILQSRDLNQVFQGALSEQVVGQLLLTSEDPLIDPVLHYWFRDKKDSQAEVDYVLQVGRKLIPVEVKSTKGSQQRSLHVLVEERQLSRAVRINAQMPEVIKITTTLGARRTFEFISLPIYLTEEMRRLLS